jgi:hypothetical protein
VIALGDTPLPPTRPGWAELTLLDERPAGWYRDPDDARTHRYWDGAGWADGLEVPQQP